MKISPDFLISTIQSRTLLKDCSWQSDHLNIICSLGDPISVTVAGRPVAGTILSWYSREEVFLHISKETELIFLLLDPAGLLDLLGNAALFREPLSQFSTTDAAAIRESMTGLLALERDSRYSADCGKGACVLNIIHHLMCACGQKDLLPEALTELSHHRYAIYRSIYTFIDSNYSSGITQADTAAYFHISPQYLARFLRDTLGMTFRELLADRRQAKMADYEAYTNLSTEEIFRHTAPDFRPDPFSAKDAPALPGRPGSFSPADMAKSQPAEVSVMPGSHSINASLNTRHHTHRFWRRLINLGYASNLQELALDATLEKIQHDIGFEYARICRITDLITSYSIDQKLYYDFSKVFPLLDQLMQNNLTPFLELGNKSFLIQESTAMSLSPVSPGESEDYYRSLEDILPHFIEACINYYGQSAVDTWMFEISYTFTSADLSSEESFNIHQYIRHFKKIYKILRSYSDVYQIGGPGFNDWHSEKTTENILKLMNSQTVTPDFYSAYAYPLEENDQGIMQISEDPDVLYKRLRFFSETVTALAPRKDIWITEFNSNLSSRNHLNDSCYQATFILRLVRQLATLPIHALGYYILSDAPLRYSDSLDFLFGGWGLLTDDNIAKPSFHAYQALASLGYYQIAAADNYIVSADSSGHFQILLHRYAPLLREYCNKNLEKKDLLSGETFIASPGTDRYQIRISNVQPGTYVIENYRINSDHSNIFKLWSQMRYLTPATADLRERLSRLSDLQPLIYSSQVGSDGIFSMDTTLHDLDIQLLIVTLYGANEEYTP